MVRDSLHSMHLKWALCYVWGGEGSEDDECSYSGNTHRRLRLLVNTPKSHTAWCGGHVSAKSVTDYAMKSFDRCCSNFGHFWPMWAAIHIYSYVHLPGLLGLTVLLTVIGSTKQATAPPYLHAHMPHAHILCTHPVHPIMHACMCGQTHAWIDAHTCTHLSKQMDCLVTPCTWRVHCWIVYKTLSKFTKKPIVIGTVPYTHNST